MSVAEIETFIQNKRAEVNILINRALAEKRVGLDEATSLRARNELLTNNLSSSFIKGEALVKLHALKRITDSMIVFSRPWGASISPEDLFARMRYLIEEDELGSKNPEIRKVAKDQVERIVESLQDVFPMQVPPPHQLYKSRWTTDPKQAEGTALLAKHCAIGAEAIYDFVRASIHPLSEGGENLQRALHTLMVGGGDCDDIAILTASLLRSLGYAVYIKCLPEHVFSGVVLGTMRGPVATKTLPADTRRGISRDHEIIYPTDYIMVPLDIFNDSFRLSDRVFDVFDIFKGELGPAVSDIIGEIRFSIRDEDKAKEKTFAKSVLQDFVDKNVGMIAEQVYKTSGASDRFLISEAPIVADGLVRVREVSDLFGEQITGALGREGISLGR